VSVCDNGLHSCPANVCQCEKKVGFGGDTSLPAAPAAAADADATAAAAAAAPPAAEASR